MLGLRHVLPVALGGALGAVARYKVGGMVLHRTEGWNFPVSTFSINVAGCLVIGVLAALVEHHDLLSPATRLFLFTGVLGGFTTFSAFGYETVFLVRRGFSQVSLLYVMLSVVCGIAAVAAGLKLVDLLWPARH